MIEDDPGIAALVAYQLTRAGYRVATATDGTGGLDAVHRNIPDLVVLDRMLPGISGDEILRTIRRDPATRALPVLVLTARREEGERIEGLELGADDYLGKPFSPQELVLRVEAILRRAGIDGAISGNEDRILRAGPITVNPRAVQVLVDGRVVGVTPTEFRILMVLILRRGQTQSRQRLLRDAWQGTEQEFQIRSRTVDMHVRRLRSKLGSAGDWIETVRGFGYRFRQGDP